MGLFDLIFRIGATSESLNKELEAAPKKTAQTAEAMAQQFRNALGGSFFSNLFETGLKAAGLGAAMTIIKDFAQAYGDKIKEINRGIAMTELDPETVQRIANVTERYGGSLEGVARAM